MRQGGTIGAIADFSEGAISRQAGARITVATPGQGFTDITDAASAFVRRSGIAQGLLTVFCRHTSASLTIQENADPEVRTDLMTALDSLAPRHAGYVHGAEGPDDMPAHIRTMVTDTALSIPVVGGRLSLGTWQAVYLIEHRDRPHFRDVHLSIIGA